MNSGPHRTFVEARRFAVSVLAEDQEALARRFASRSADRFAGVAWHARTGEPPLLDGAIAHFLCTKTTDYRVGDHELFVGRVDEARFHPGQPLLFFHSRFEKLHSQG